MNYLLRVLMSSLILWGMCQSAPPPGNDTGGYFEKFPSTTDKARKACAWDPNPDVCRPRNLTGASMVTHRYFHYGRFEIRWLSNLDVDGAVPAFFLYANETNIYDTNSWQEIDFEVHGKGWFAKTPIQTNIITGWGFEGGRKISEQFFGVPGVPQTHEAQTAEAKKKWHVFVLEWTKEYVAWYLDKKLLRRDEACPHLTMSPQEAEKVRCNPQVNQMTQPMRLYMSAWILDPREWWARYWAGVFNSSATDFPLVTYIDYIRYSQWNQDVVPRALQNGTDKLSDMGRSATSASFEESWMDDFTAMRWSTYGPNESSDLINLVEFVPERIQVVGGQYLALMIARRGQNAVAPVPLDPHQQRANRCYAWNEDMYGSEIEESEGPMFYNNVTSAFECQLKCQAIPACRYFVYKPVVEDSNCWLKKQRGEVVSATGREAFCCSLTGPKYCNHTKQNLLDEDSSMKRPLLRFAPTLRDTLISDDSEDLRGTKTMHQENFGPPNSSSDNVGTEPITPPSDQPAMTPSPPSSSPEPSDTSSTYATSESAPAIIDSKESSISPSEEAEIETAPPPDDTTSADLAGDGPSVLGFADLVEELLRNDISEGAEGENEEDMPPLVEPSQEPGNISDADISGEWGEMEQRDKSGDTVPMSSRRGHAWDEDIVEAPDDARCSNFYIAAFRQRRPCVAAGHRPTASDCLRQGCCFDRSAPLGVPSCYLA